MNKQAQDIMMGAPAQVDPRQLKDVHIEIKLPKEEKQANFRASDMI